MTLKYVFPAKLNTALEKKNVQYNCRCLQQESEKRLEKKKEDHGKTPQKMFSKM